MTLYDGFHGTLNSRTKYHNRYRGWKGDINDAKRKGFKAFTDIWFYYAA